MQACSRTELSGVGPETFNDERLMSPPALMHNADNRAMNYYVTAVSKTGIPRPEKAKPRI